MNIDRLECTFNYSIVPKAQQRIARKMEASGFDEAIFNDYSSDTVGILSPHGPKAIQHHPPNSHYMQQHQQAAIMIGNANGEINQHQRLPDVHQILPGSSPNYKLYAEVKPYSPNGKLEYISNGTSNSSPSAGQKLEYASATNGQYSPNAKIIEYSSPHPMDQHTMMFQQPQPVDNNQQNIMNGANSNFKRKSNEHLNNLSGSPSSNVNGISSTDASGNSPNKKPIDKKKNDPNGVKKKKTR